ncbi:MAG: hypothetical protein E7510_08055 [Ruminococcus sp.]|nr:hypothetical protein [Ruminococcus sp.]
MIKKISEYISDIFVKHSIINKEDRNVYSYGAELLLSVFINIFIAIIIASVTGLFIEIMLFTSAFVFIRQYTGGYHADTHHGCICLFAVVLTLFSIVIKHIPVTVCTIIFTVFSIFSFVFVSLLAPVEHKNKPINNKLRSKLRKQSILCVTFICIFSLLLCICGFKVYSLSLSFGSIVSVTSMIVGYLANKFS